MKTELFNFYKFVNFLNFVNFIKIIKNIIYKLNFYFILFFKFKKSKINNKFVVS